MTRSPWLAALAAVLFLLGGGGGSALAGPSALSWKSSAPRLQVSPLGQIPEPVSLVTLVRYLERMGLEGARVDEGQGFVRVRIKGESGRFDLFLIPRGQLLHLQVPKLVEVPRESSAHTRVLELLLELNWVNVLGKYSWDPGDGEVRYGHCLVVPAGVSFGEFSLAVAQCLKTVDVDYPRLERAAREGSKGEGIKGARPGDPPAGSEGHP